MTQLRSLPRLIRKLQDALGDHLCVALDDPNVVEIMLNPDGKLFIERLGHGISPAGEMSNAAAEIVIGSVAHVLASEVDDERPIVSGELPIGGHRFEVFCRQLFLAHPSRFGAVPRASFLSTTTFPKGS